ncbi:alpha/beta fold hydrolase [Halobaculum sp. D14]|uniref:alpha/beta fold hydrolase n=1 Tax=unclassified Halobaculum TaxID=2640896 RepID=UPI003EB859E0
MPYATHDGVDVYYESDGSGEPVVFLGEIGLGPWQWGWQHARVAGPYEAVVPATRGTDESGAPPAPWTMADLVGDVDAVLADAGVDSAHFVGVGFGAALAMRIALSEGRAETLTLVGAAASGRGIDADALWADPSDPEALHRSLEAALSADFFDRQPDDVARMVEWRGAEDADRDAWTAAKGALDDFDVSDRLYELTTPTLVLHGTEDAVCPPTKGEELAAGLPRGEHVPVDGAGHLANVEHSRVVNDHLLAFLDEHTDE